MPAAEALELLMARLENHHPQRQFLEQKLHRTTAGIRGERRLQKKFTEFYQEEEFHILWNINLRTGNWPVQMDGLLLTGRCAVIIESKNINGQLHFDEKTGEFFRLNSEGEKTVLEDPRIQLNKHIRFLKLFFKMNKINLPVSGLVVFTAKDCEFISKPQHAPICKTYQLIEYLLKILQAFPLEAETLTLNKTKKAVISNQAPYSHSPLCKHYFIESKDLKPGIFCPNCKTLSMKRDKRSWMYNTCGLRDASAHLLAIREYLTFVETKITNQKLRKFCGFESRSLATRLLTQVNLVRSGESKAHAYYLQK